ncbi:MAG: ATPase, T2SS/T4P/T4SS family [Candidatus Omnitrophica bacterium]|nr:ATPase, T2SS/T4P/T4SS family [Candidatus Omnitrophota bacterium]
MTLSLKEALVKALLGKGLLTEARLKEALKIQEQKGGDLKDILTGSGFVKREDLISVLSQHYSIPPINLARLKIEPDVLKLVPAKVAQHYRIIPVSKVETVLSVAVSDPLNIFALDHVAAMTGLKVLPVLAAEADIENAISEYYEDSSYEEIEKVISGLSSSDVSVSIVEESKQMFRDAEQLLQATENAPVVKLANQLLSNAVRMRSSDILIEPFEAQTRIRYRIDGLLKEVQVFPKALHEPVVSRFKIMSSLDISEQRLPQDGRFKIKVQGREVDFRISVLPSVLGEKVALRVLDKSIAQLDIAMLGFHDRAQKDLKEAVGKPHGMILICGPTGSGKTTTLYALLKLIESPEDNIITVEDPIEYQMEGLNQVSARPELGLTFASALRSILRQDPDIIMIGEIRDYETADISVKAALTGHLLLTTLHTTTATGALVRLINIGIEPFLISSSVILTAAQRLVRKICPDCKAPYQLDEELKARLGIKDKGKVTLYRGNGCHSCMNTGYRGRIALIETLIVTPAIRQLIDEKAQEYKIREQARKEGMVGLREDGLEKAKKGVITLEEVLRVTVGEQDIETRVSGG